MNDSRLPLTYVFLVALSLCADAAGPRSADKKQAYCLRLRAGPTEFPFACFCRQRLRLRGGGGPGNGKLDGKRRNMYGTERSWKGPKPWVKNEQPRTIDIHKAKLDKRAAKRAHTSRENVLKKRMTERARHSRRDFRREQFGGDQVFAVHADLPRAHLPRVLLTGILRVGAGGRYTEDWRGQWSPSVAGPHSPHGSSLPERFPFSLFTRCPALPRRSKVKLLCEVRAG